jgi:hypothetical protein
MTSRTKKQEPTICCLQEIYLTDRNKHWLGVKGWKVPHIMKARYDEPLASILLHSEKIKSFPIKSEMRKGYLLYPLLLNIVLEFLVREIRQKREIKEIQIGKEEVKFSNFQKV